MKYIITAIIIAVCSIESYAQDRLFGYTYQSNVLNKGNFDLESKYEIEKEITREDNITKAIWESNSPVELYIAYMHFFKPEIGWGIEVRNNNDIIEEDGWLNSVWFAGPAFHATIDKFFIN